MPIELLFFLSHPDWPGLEEDVSDSGEKILYLHAAHQLTFWILDNQNPVF